MEQQIRDLCNRLLSAEDEKEFHAISAQLREALHDKIEKLRFEARQLALAEKFVPVPDPPVQPNTTDSSDALESRVFKALIERNRKPHSTGARSKRRPKRAPPDAAA